MLRKDAATNWTKDCQNAFDRIKEYLSTPPVLVPPEPGRPLILYISILDGAFGYVLIRVPESIITDSAANLNSDLMKAMYENFKIKHKNFTAYRPQMNGAMEAANKNIKKLLKKMVDNHKQWHKRLPFALLGYQTTVCMSTGATPYLLVYGMDSVIPAEVEIPSLRIIQEAELSDAEWVRSRYEQLALIDGKRMNAVCHGQLYQNRISRAFNKRVKPRHFAPGQMMLK
ncbi:uncharacterized protein [Nicotiana tomentosiformis]|uniref:uncharacterized protein n=1 Tax=Nicotiana tomentosiformis TaxID=4098 RepID=UPI00388CBDD7